MTASSRCPPQLRFSFTVAADWLFVRHRTDEHQIPVSINLATFAEPRCRFGKQKGTDGFQTAGDKLSTLQTRFPLLLYKSLGQSTKLIARAGLGVMRSQRFIEAILVGKSILLREGLAGILRAANFQILASVSSADDLRPAKNTPHPRLYLILQTGDDFGIALQQITLFRNRHPEARVALVTDHCRLDELTLAFRAGAHGYFISDITSEKFVRSVSLVMMGETIVPAALIKLKLDGSGSRLAGAANDPKNGKHISFAAEDATAPFLSQREREILRCITEGASNKSIARKMDITEATVKSHVKAILRTIGAENRTQAAIWGMNNGFRIQPEIERCPIKQIAAPATADLVSTARSQR